MYNLPEIGLCLPCHFDFVEQVLLIQIHLLGGMKLYGKFFFGTTVAEKRDRIAAFIQDTLEESDAANQLHIVIDNPKLIEEMLASNPSEMILEHCHLYTGTEQTLHGTLLHAGFITEGNQG